MPVPAVIVIIIITSSSHMTYQVTSNCTRFLSALGMCELNCSKEFLSDDPMYTKFLYIYTYMPMYVLSCVYWLCYTASFML